MNCPCCKKSVSSKNKFCGECGSQLGPSAETLAELLADDHLKDVNAQEVERKLVDWTTKQLRTRMKRWSLVAGCIVIVVALSFEAWAGIWAHRRLTIHESEMAAELAKLESEERAERLALQAERAKTPLVPGVGTSAPSAATVSSEVHNQLQEQLKDRKFVELDIADETKGLLISWAKDVSFFIGIPVALVVALFGFLGAKSYTDLKGRADSAITDFNTGLENSSQRFRVRTQDELERIKKKSHELYTKLEESQREAQEKLMQMEKFYEKYTITTKNLSKLLGPLTAVIAESLKAKTSEPPTPEPPTPLKPDSRTPA